MTEEILTREEKIEILGYDPERRVPALGDIDRLLHYQIAKLKSLGYIKPEPDMDLEKLRREVTELLESQLALKYRPVIARERSSRLSYQIIALIKPEPVDLEKVREEIAIREYTHFHKPALDLVSGFRGEIEWGEVPESVKLSCYIYADSILALIQPLLSQVREQNRQELLTDFQNDFKLVSEGAKLEVDSKLKATYDEGWRKGYEQAHVDHPSVGDCELQKIIQQAKKEERERILKSLETQAYIVTADDIELGDLDLSVGDRVIWYPYWQALKEGK